MMLFARALALMLSAASPSQGRADAGATSPLVRATVRIPDLVEDLRYATADNFLKSAVYPPGAVCWLHEEALAKLVKAAASLRQAGYRLRVYDCYRPLSVQWQMWKLFPKPGYVADPKKGSNHNRGAAVDLTLADKEGKELEMPTPFDTFSKAAHHGYAGATKTAISHREVLREAMEAAGFKRNRMEWWHYDLPDATRYPVLDAPLLP